MSEHIVDLLSAGRDREYRESKINGVVIGIVTNIQDPDKMGRVKVRFPWLMDKEQDESHWARIAPLMAGKGRGSWFIPEVDDEVLVTFEHGNIHFPYIIAMLWNGKDVPPVFADVTGQIATPGSYQPKVPSDIKGDNTKNDTRFIRSRSGHLFIFDDTDGKERISIVDKSGTNHFHVITKGESGKVGQDKGKLILTSENGDIELHAPNGTIYLESKFIETKSTKSTKMHAETTFDTLADKDMSHKTQMNLKVEASTNADYKAGAAATFKAGATMTVESGAPMTIKSGALMNIEAAAIMTIKGALVKIN